jgi:hypothetical protein
MDCRIAWISLIFATKACRNRMLEGTVGPKMVGRSQAAARTSSTQRLVTRVDTFKTGDVRELTAKTPEEL